jgi:glycosyltransferase involved in cell wall biosynthesis
VIVPVYKAEAYLHRCVDSLLAQTMSEFELLLIDDGSPDGSGAICDEYVAKDSRVRVFHKSNGGVSSARQCGVDNARGEYIIHADPDDWVEPAMLEELYAKAVSENADVVICDYFAEHPNETYYSRQQPSKNDALTVLRGFFAHLHGACWNKLVRREAILRYNVRFDTRLSYCEDTYYHSTLLVNPVRIAYLPKAFYHYDQRMNTNSIVSKYNAESFEYDKMLHGKYCSLLKGTAAFEAADRSLRRLIVTRAFYGGIFSSALFKEQCASYADAFLVRGKITFSTDIMFYLSCKGCYRAMYRVYRFLKLIKK